MSVVTYTTFDGELVEENRDGTILDYVPDSLGSIIMWVDETGLPVSYTPYWPYGEPWQEPEVECPFQFVGKYGYYRDLSGTYVRARVYEPEFGRWMTVDRYWPLECPYSYVSSAPTGRIDPAGLGISYDCPDGSILPTNFGEMCEALIKCYLDRGCRSRLEQCWGPNGAAAGIKCMYKFCKGDYPLDVSCDGAECCKKRSRCGYTYSGIFISCRIHVCMGRKDVCGANYLYFRTLIHELSHCCGTDDHEPPDAHAIAPCINNVIKDFR